MTDTGSTQYPVGSRFAPDGPTGRMTGITPWAASGLHDRGGVPFVTDRSHFPDRWTVLRVSCASSASSSPKPPPDAAAGAFGSVMGNDAPHWLQNLLLTVFLKLHFGHGSFNFLEGMATNRPLFPSMIFTFLTTNILSNVIVAYAFSFLSWPSFIRPI